MIDLNELGKTSFEISMEIKFHGRLYNHNKTDNKYFLLNEHIIECTNGREDKKYVLYMNDKGMLFCRERDEFYQKFTKC